MPIIDDSEVKDPNVVERIVLCSGKVFYDLSEARRSSPSVKEDVSEPGASVSEPRRVGVATGSKRNGPRDHVALIRLEQFYPFPLKGLKTTIERYPNANELVWCQEEPRNMGGWTFMESRLENLLPRCERPRYVGRDVSASPATGSYAVHRQEQERLVKEALTLG
jgi:2-oxoglutarate dehydrogenase E1 component